MSATEFPLNDPLAIQRWSTSLSYEAAKKTYFSKFIGTGKDNLITLKTELNKGAGEKITVGLRMKLSGSGIEGDNTIEGTSAEEALTFYNDALLIDQLRKGTKSKGKMTEQRVPYNLRKEGRDALSTWWAEELDEELFIYLAGEATAASIDTVTHGNVSSNAGRADNAVTAPSTIVYSGAATSKASLTAADKMSLAVVDKSVALAETLDPMMRPLIIDGERKFVLVMHTFDAFNMRQGTSANDWLALRKATDRGNSGLIYKNALGEFADTILHKHRGVLRYNDYGGAAVKASRSLFMGAQAALIAYGQDQSPQRYSWNEETDDRGNALAITAGTIFAVKKSTYNLKDFGCMVIDSGCASPV